MIRMAVKLAKRGFIIGIIFVSLYLAATYGKMVVLEAYGLFHETKADVEKYLEKKDTPEVGEVRIQLEKHDGFWKKEGEHPKDH